MKRLSLLLGLLLGSLLLSLAAWAATSTAFMPMTTTKTISASGTSASATFANNDKAGDCLRIFNANTETAFIKYGIGAQTATTAGLPVAPGAVEIIQVGEAMDTIAVITAGAGGAAVYATKGSGL